MIRNQKVINNSKSANSKLTLDLNKMDLKTINPINSLFPNTISNYFIQSIKFITFNQLT